MDKIQCVYCLERKSIESFNTEHVISKFMGRYTNAQTLHDHQVCQSCNTFFCDNIENVISLDSFEALQRMVKGNRKMSSGRFIRNNRVKSIGVNGIFKEIVMKFSTDSNSQNKFDINPEKCIMFTYKDKNISPEKYNSESLPICTDEVISKLDMIIYYGMEKEEFFVYLKEKGYDIFIDLEKHYMTFNEINKDKNIQILHMIEFDLIMTRFIAKTIFNYAIFKLGKDFILKSEFNKIREFIRYGKNNVDIFINYKETIEQFTSQLPHSIILFWKDESQDVLYGCLTWFNEIAYIIKLASFKEKQKIILHRSIYNNKSDNNSILDEDGTYIFYN